MKRIKKIYIDLDGVLADFDRGVRELCGMEPRYQNGKISKVDSDTWWARVAAVDHFYAKLKVIPGAKEMFDALYAKYGDACEILSAIPRPQRGVKNAEEDKREWVHRLISKDIALNIVYRDDKKDYCTGKDCILIDDFGKNIEEWKAEGGTGVLFKDPKDVIEAIAAIEAELPLEIEIANKREPHESGYFSFYSVKIENNKYTAFTDSHIYSDDGFYILDWDIQCFLDCFLRKHFDPDLKYNREREEVAAGVEENVFDWYGSNYYTYDTMRNLCSEVLQVASMLKNDYDNPELDEIKQSFELWRMISEEDPDYEIERNSPETIKRHSDVVISFYERFAKRVTKMMEQYSDNNLFVITGD